MSMVIDYKLKYLVCICGKGGKGQGCREGGEGGLSETINNCACIIGNHMLLSAIWE